MLAQVFTFSSSPRGADMFTQHSSRSRSSSPHRLRRGRTGIIAAGLAGLALSGCQPAPGGPGGPAPTSTPPVTTAPATATPTPTPTEPPVTATPTPGNPGPTPSGDPTSTPTPPENERLLPMGMLQPGQEHDDGPVIIRVDVGKVGENLPAVSGTVEIVINGTIRKTLTLEPGPGNGTATWVVRLDPGPQRMIATYSGNEFYQPITFESGTTVQNGRLEITPPDRIVAGQPYTVRVKVVPINGATGTPSGTVRIWHGFWPGEATVTLDKTGSASATMTGAYPVGNPPSALPMYVEYAGDGTFLPLYRSVVPYIPYSLPDADPADGSAADQTATDGG